MTKDGKAIFVNLMLAIIIVSMVLAMLYPASLSVIAIKRNFAVIAVNCTKYKLSSITIITYFSQDFCVGTSFKCLILFFLMCMNLYSSMDAGFTE